SDTDKFASALSDLEAAHGRIDLLVNDAGIGEPDGDAIEKYRTVFETNFFAAVAGTLAVLPGLVERSGGVGVNVPPASGRAPGPGSTTPRDRRHARGTPRAGCASARPRRIPAGREVVHPELMPVPELVALDVAAGPDAWRALGFAIDEDGACAVDGVAIRLGR